MDIYAKSIPSELHPRRNEDALLVDHQHNIFGIFDGMGGHATGEVASCIARDDIAQALTTLPKESVLQDVEKAIGKALTKAGASIFAQATKIPAQRGMGTTATVIKILQGKEGAYNIIIGHVGDSRAYVFSKDGALEQLTIDDGMVREFINDERHAAMIEKKLNNVTDPRTLTPQEKMLFTHRNMISQSLGSANVKPMVSRAFLHNGAKIILTSDGVHDNLTDKEISNIVTKAQNAEEAVENLIQSSLERSREQHLRAKADDMSVIVVVL